MNLSTFFITRPIFAIVIALGIALAGVLALRQLPVEQYPSVAPPSLVVGLTYPGADAATIEQNVTQIIEQELNGVEGFLYMASTSESNGTASITLTFESGTDLDTAQLEVTNRINRIEQRLPEEVRRQGIPINKAAGGFLEVVALTSKSGATPGLELGNIAYTTVIDELRRVRGVGDIRLFGSQYAMRIWLDPAKLAGYKLSASEALAAVQEQNSQTAGGALGEQPVARGSEFNATIITQNRFTTAEQFANIILRANPDGSAIRLGDVGRVELGAANYQFSAELNGRPMAGLGVQLIPGANQLETARGVDKVLESLRRRLPADVEVSVPYNTTPFITISIEEVVKTLVEAMLLVFLVMFLFLQNIRSTVIPTLVVPIALLGACLGLWVFGFSINVLTLFGMVLAIGILVDDAIVVIENVERIMAEEHLSPADATRKAMGQITSAIIGITLVLVAVFVPMAFFPGSTGGIYRQFAVTLAVSIGFSALLALTLTPALCAILLKPYEPGVKARGRFAFVGRFFDRFNGWFGRSTERYQHGVSRMIATPVRWLAVFLALVGVTALLFGRLPSGFLPDEDQGYAISVVQAPPGATTQRTEEALRRMRAYYAGVADIRDTIALKGFSFFAQGQTAAIMFASFKDWDERHGAEHGAAAIVAKANQAFAGIGQAFVFVLSPPPISELGNASGFTMKLQDRAGRGPADLMAQRNKLLGMASQNKALVGVRPEGLDDAPQLRVLIDRIKARALGLTIGEVNQTLAIAFGSAYANDFNYQGRVLQVLLQADAAYRMTPADVLDLRVRNANGDMVPFGAFTTATWTAGPPQLQRYNGYSAATISGVAAPGTSSSVALDEMETMARSLPEGYTFEWTGTSYEERQSQGQIGLLLALSLLVVFLVLAALYESWTIPIAVLLVVPLGVLGAILFSMARGLSADVYFNVGLITIIGLTAKNAILIVEFAIEREAEGADVRTATLDAVTLRLRPIVMTSLAFILGMVPLVISTGAGSASRRAVGTGVMGGMITATILGIFLIPVFYIAVRRWLVWRKPKVVAEGAA